MYRGALLSEIVALGSDRAGEAQGQLLVVDSDSVPQAAKHSGEIVAEQQRVEREGDPAVDAAQVIRRCGPRVEHLLHTRRDFQHRVLIEAVAIPANRGSDARWGDFNGSASLGEASGVFGTSEKWVFGQIGGEGKIRPRGGKSGASGSVPPAGPPRPGHGIADLPVAVVVPHHGRHRQARLGAG